MSKKRVYANFKKQVDTFLDTIDVIKLIRDTIFQVLQDGTCVWYNRQNKYIQFLKDDEITIRRRVDGKWLVEYDMKSLEKYEGTRTITHIDVVTAIEAAPEEITVASWNNYKKDQTKYRFVPLDINKTEVIKLRGDRNSPFGIPYCVPALSSIIHRDLLEKTEKALADRIINQIVIQKIGNMIKQDGKTHMPPPKEKVAELHNNLRTVLKTKYDKSSTDNSSVAPLTVPDFVSIEPLKVEMDTFPEEIWDRVDRNIYQKLGYSSSINIGGGTGQSFGAGTINIQKVYSVLFSVLEVCERGINNYLKQLPDAERFNPNFWIFKQTYLDSDEKFKQAEALFLKGRGSLKYYVESSGISFDHYLAQIHYENEVLKINDLPIHETSFTQSTNSDSGGRPTDNKSDNDNTQKSKGNGANDSPSPSD